MTTTSVSTPLGLLILDAASTYPERAAVEIGTQTWTYQEVAARAMGTTLSLIEAGVSAGDRVGIWMDRNIDTVVSVLAAWILGAAYVPLSPETLNPGLQSHFPQRRLDTMLADIDPKVVLTEANTDVPGWDGPILEADSSSSALESFPPQSRPSKDFNPIAYHIYTSGSTGVPKAVTISQHAVIWLRNALNTAIYDKHSPSMHRRTLNAPLGFDPSVQQLVGLLDGATLVIVPARVRTHGREFLNFLRSSQIDVLDTTPAQLRLLVEAGLADPESQHPKLVLCGGASIDKYLWQSLAMISDKTIYNMYGVTEATVDSTIAQITGDEPTIGVPLPGAQVSIGGDVAPMPSMSYGELGNLWIGGISSAIGYWNRPELTKEKFFVDDSGTRWFNTGNLASINPNGRIQFHGRADRQVKIRSHRVELDEVENVLNLHQSIHTTAVVEEDGHLVAYLEWAKPNDLDTVDLRRHLRSHVPDYMMPQEFRSVKTIPITNNGKIDYGSLRQLSELESLREQRTNGASRDTSILSILEAAWSEALAEDTTLSADSDFFELGGDSIAIVGMLVKLEDVCGMELPLADLIERPIFENHIRVLENLLPKGVH